MGVATPKMVQGSGFRIALTQVVLGGNPLQIGRRSSSGIQLDPNGLVTRRLGVFTPMYGGSHPHDGSGFRFQDCLNSGRLGGVTPHQIGRRSSFGIQLDPNGLVTRRLGVFTPSVWG